MEELEKLRKQIDQLDKMIAELISKRQGLSNKILKAKGRLGTEQPQAPFGRQQITFWTYKSILGPQN